MDGQSSFFWVLLTFSILINLYAFHRLILLPIFAEVFYWGCGYFVGRIISRHDKRLELVLDEVIKKAEEKGFAIKRPEVRILKRNLGLLRIRGTPARACASGGYNRILFDEKWLKISSYSHMLRAIMAHELGHIVDYQTKREGHPLFARIRYVSAELFADAFAALLYSKQEVIDYREPSYLDFDKKKFMELDLDLDNPKRIDIRAEDIQTKATSTA